MRYYVDPTIETKEGLNALHFAVCIRNCSKAVLEILLKEKTRYDIVIEHDFLLPILLK